MIRTALALAALTATAQAWDLAGHMIVGEIAWQKSTPAVRAKVDAIVRGLDTTFSTGRPYNFVTANAWLDDMRAMRKYPWGRLHYIDMPKTADGSAFAVGEPPHVVSAIKDSLAQVRDPQASPAKLTESLAILIHCVGDIHQPMHVCTWNDRGGNGYLVAGVAFADLYKGGRGNLHAFWDQGYRVEARDGKIVESFTTPPITSRAEPGQPGVIADTAAKIMEEFPADQLAAEIAIQDPAEWARESHVLGCTVGYPEGPHPGDHSVRKLEPEFATATRKVAARRVALAGYRLAEVLKAAFPE